MMARRTRQNYIDADELRDALIESQHAGEPTVRLCNLLRLLISHFLAGPRWSGYDASTREDLASAALVKCLKNVKNFKAEKSSAFTYMTLCCQTSCIDFLSKHYTQKNILREVRTLKRDEWLGSVPEYVRSGKIPPLPPLQGRRRQNPEGRTGKQAVGKSVIR